MSMEKARQHCIQDAMNELSILESVDFSQPIPTDMLFKIMFHTKLANMNGVLEQLVKEIHPDARIRNYFQFDNQVVIDVPITKESYVTLRLEEYKEQPQISIIDDWLVSKPQPIDRYLLDNKNAREQFLEQYLALLEQHAGWLEKARARCLKENKKSVLHLFFWWFFVIKPKDRCNIEYCKACIDSEISIHINTYNSHIKSYNESVRLAQIVVYQLIPLLEKKCSRVVAADGIRQQAKEAFLPLA